MKKERIYLQWGKRVSDPATHLFVLANTIRSEAKAAAKCARKAWAFVLEE